MARRSAAASAEAPVAKAALPAKVWTVEQAAEFLQIRPQGVRNLAAQGRLAYFRVGRLLRFSGSDVVAYLASVRREPRP